MFAISTVAFQCSSHLFNVALYAVYRLCSLLPYDVHSIEMFGLQSLVCGQMLLSLIHCPVARGGQGAVGGQNLRGVAEV